MAQELQVVKVSLLFVTLLVMQVHLQLLVALQSILAADIKYTFGLVQVVLILLLLPQLQAQARLLVH